MTKKRKIWIGVLCLVTFLWTAFIFSRSMQTGSESSEASGRLTALLQALLGIPVSEHFVRKLAHFGEYMILALPATGAVLLVSRRWLLPFAWVYALLVAFTDEFLVQAMTAGRGPRITDVLIDGAGALTGLLLTVAVFLILGRIRAGRTQ